MVKNFRNKFEIFKAKFNNIVSERKTIEVCMFLFGLKIKSYHCSIPGVSKEYFEMHNSIGDELRSQWDYEILRSIQNGADENGDFDENTQGVASWLYDLRRAIQFRRPDWGLYYLIGAIKGYLNFNENELGAVCSSYARIARIIYRKAWSNNGKRGIRIL